MSAFEYDPTTLAFQVDPLPVFRTLRNEHPAYHNERLRFWALTRFDDVWNAASDWERFASHPDHYGPRPDEPTLLMPRAMMDFGIFYLDPPRHDRMRRLLSKAFTPRRVAALEPIVRDLCRRLIAEFAEKGACELLHDFAAPLATQVIGALLGVPERDRWQFRLWAEKIEQHDDSVPAEQALRDQAEAIASIHAYLGQLVAERRRAPQDDLLSGLLAAEVEGLRLSDEQVVGMGYQLMVAGNDTTASLISNGTLRLAENPDQLRLLVESPERIVDAVEEMARYDAPTVQSPPRITTCDVELHGRVIPKGSPVLLVWMAANHDERRFDAPERFDVTRSPNRHLGFGHGLHFCIGSSLARVESRIAFEALLGAMPELVLSAPPRRWASVWLRSLGSVPVEFDAARATAWLDRTAA
ncbi:MAG: cytochrome P450 [Deltaproteobacteria bacterium]|nr:cytochrome P450 [Deltaproteobacteria bacterium]